ncbi:unnamed protein product, partial [Closterium sp. NIES-65]
PAASHSAAALILSSFTGTSFVTLADTAQASETQRLPSIPAPLPRRRAVSASLAFLVSLTPIWQAATPPHLPPWYRRVSGER